MFRTRGKNKTTSVSLHSVHALGLDSKHSDPFRRTCSHFAGVEMCLVQKGRLSVPSRGWGLGLPPPRLRASFVGISPPPLFLCIELGHKAINRCTENSEKLRQHTSLLFFSPGSERKYLERERGLECEKRHQEH